MKIGLDMHGVIDANPMFYRNLAQAIIDAGGEVHIISGSHMNKLKREIAKYEVPYTHLFSVTSYHENRGVEIIWDSKNEPHMPNSIWNPTKGDYCKKHNIDLMLDDSPRYGEFFSTDYAQIKR